MIRYSLPTSSRARLGVACTVALLGLTALPLNQAKAALADPAAVVTNDTYSIEAVGFNTTTPSGDILIIAPNLPTTFGTTQAFGNSALPLTPGGSNYQTLTVSSNESTAAGVTTDTISLSVPTNFIPAGTKDNNGNLINAIQFSFGNYLGGTDPLDFSLASSNYTVTTSITTNGAVVPGGSSSTVSNGGLSLSGLGPSLGPPNGCGA